MATVGVAVREDLLEIEGTLQRCSIELAEARRLKNRIGYALLWIVAGVYGVDMALDWLGLRWPEVSSVFGPVGALSIWILVILFVNAVRIYVADRFEISRFESRYGALCQSLGRLLAEDAMTRATVVYSPAINDTNISTTQSGESRKTTDSLRVRDNT
jgi:hypothetical protein